jgi:hypothetical protein
MLISMPCTFLYNAEGVKNAGHEDAALHQHYGGIGDTPQLMSKSYTDISAPGTGSLPLEDQAMPVRVEPSSRHRPASRGTPLDSPHQA